ncbi:aldehyde dehydrogenase [candidate division KSB1 bacterium]|nr:aldehyde dehydrogenase [candidate division KSB1 bacterium]
MNFTEEQISTIVRQVVENIGLQPEVNQTVAPIRHENEWGVFETVDDAIDAADKAFQEYQKFGLQDRKAFTDAIRKMCMERQEELSRMVFEETQMGRYEDKLLKHQFAASETPGIENLETTAWSGKNGLALEEWAPYGIIGAITPSTHPSETMINNSIMMLAAGNVVIFCPHPSAKNVSNYTVKRINEVLVDAGAPENLIVCVQDPTLDTAKQVLNHEKIRLLSITGGPAVVRAAMKTNKKVIAAGPGNPPVVIDESADLDHAAERITLSAGFDNNILCTAEKEIFVVESVFSAFMQAMQKPGNVLLNQSQVEQLAQKAFEKKKYLHILSRDLVGRNASVLAKAIGLNISDEVCLLYGETQNDHVFVQEEQMMPFIPVVKVKDFEQGVQLALEAEHGYGHTASVFTNNMTRATDFAKRANCSIFVINGGTFQGNGGEQGEGTLAFTIATPTGEGITRPTDFARIRRIMNVGSFRFV